MTHVGLVISSSCDARLSLTGRFRSPRESLDCLSVTKKPAGCFSRNNAVQNRKRARCHSHQPLRARIVFRKPSGITVHVLLFLLSFCLGPFSVVFLMSVLTWRFTAGRQASLRLIEREAIR